MRCAYIDSSVFLRSLLREPALGPDLSKFDRLYTSEIAELECRRVLDRIRIQEKIPDAELALRYRELQEQLKATYMISLGKSILRRACESFPVVVRSLDSLHLSSFILIQSSTASWTFVTHDLKLKAAALALGFDADG